MNLFSAADDRYLLRTLFIAGRQWGTFSRELFCDPFLCIWRTCAQNLSADNDKAHFQRGPAGLNRSRHRARSNR